MAGELKRSNSTFNISASPKLFTLAIVNTGGRVLLGLKKRGFGEGYFNGFGGKLEEGESIDEAAAREVHVFNVPDYMGKPCETEEMLPTWFAHEDIPYDKMWMDDKVWYPHFLKGDMFKGKFFFENTHNLVSYECSVVEAL
ncbi:7,8-dihydro-8-oxoguanine triphosphatase isoform X2 [Amborella trichopoda]|uniref:7,8-dihydro-8-oxoguanine triphosphatase isoform X2 n=1 Tax=Amborella trichopoda TaxID=13333 RepID=UPI0005D3F970|nr:7,8-dihydro-8-oxoguanine triphosphatase isoform X2 [Amborella trichopoda]|eukprot:XP_011627048.1 7,8-dihydro-8-oxoguanine triphosphatase isoform X2 [Amborella trichopoda]